MLCRPTFATRVWGFVNCAGCIMLRSLRRVCATALHHVFAVAIAAAMATCMIWTAFAPPVAAQELPPLTIPNGTDCRRNEAACLAASGTAASAPQVSEGALQSALRDIRDSLQGKASSSGKA